MEYFNTLLQNQQQSQNEDKRPLISYIIKKLKQLLS